MKHKVFCWFKVSFNCLYIPHGSDETNKLSYQQAKFIALYIPHGSDETHDRRGHYTRRAEALYPTRFRWNKLGQVIEKLYDKLYIPHGSDETLWNKYRRIFLLRLYIPHGSDETYVTIESFNSGKYLYIPHGSDET